MRGVVLAGGLGTRLDPITRIINKHLLPVYDKPMIYHPIRTLVNAGIEDILIVTGGRNAGDFLRLLGNGREFGLKHLDYTYQEGEGGIAEALDLARHFSRGEKLCVMLGDNIIERNVVAAVDAFRCQEGGAKIPAEGSPRSGALRRSVFRGRPHRRYRGKARSSPIELRRHGHLYVRWHCLRQDRQA